MQSRDEKRRRFLEQRRNGIGASDAPAIMGVSPWKSALGLYVEKKGLDPESGEEKEWHDWGHRLEEPIARKFQDDHPEYDVIHYLDPETDESATIYDPRDPRVFCHPDRGLVHKETGRKGLLQIKTTNAWNLAAWESGTPTDIRVQVQHELMVCEGPLEAEFAYVAVLVGGNHYEEHREDHHRRLQGVMFRRELEFLEALATETPPPASGHRREHEALRALYPKAFKDGPSIDLDADALEWTREHLKIKADIKALEARKTELESRIMEQIGDNAYGILPGERGRWTWTRRKAYVRPASNVPETRILYAPRKLKE